MIVRVAMVALGLTLGMAGGALAGDGDVKKGKKVFKKCQACHKADKKSGELLEENAVGPHLVGILGRKSGAVEDFKYSEAMAELDIVWDEETLAEFLKKPKEMVPKTKMSFAGLRKDKQIKNLIAYLKESGGMTDSGDGGKKEKKKKKDKKKDEE